MYNNALIGTCYLIRCLHVYLEFHEKLYVLYFGFSDKPCNWTGRYCGGGFIEELRFLMSLC